MILDSRNEFCDATALNTGAAGSYLIGNVIDLGSSSPVANGKPQMFLVITVDTAVTSAGAATVQFTLASDAQAAIAVDGSATVHGATGAIGKANLVAGATYVIPLAPGNYERYLGVLQTTGVAALTAGKVNAFLTADPKEWMALDNGIS